MKRDGGTVESKVLNGSSMVCSRKAEIKKCWKKACSRLRKRTKNKYLKHAEGTVLQKMQMCVVIADE